MSCISGQMNLTARPPLLNFVTEAIPYPGSDSVKCPTFRS